MAQSRLKIVRPLNFSSTHFALFAGRKVLFIPLAIFRSCCESNDEDRNCVIDLPRNESLCLEAAVVPVVVAVIVVVPVVVDLERRIAEPRASEDVEDDGSAGPDDAEDGEEARARKRPWNVPRYRPRRLPASVTRPHRHLRSRPGWPRRSYETPPHPATAVCFPVYDCNKENIRHNLVERANDWSIPPYKTKHRGTRKLTN